MTRSEQSCSLRDAMDALEKLLGGEAKVLREASGHRYSCTCDTCREWWRLVGRDPDTGLYGPFGTIIDD